MLRNEQIIALLFLCSLAITYVALGNSLSESQNAKLFHETGELRQSRWVVVLLFVFASFAMLFAAVMRHNRLGEPSWPMAMFALFLPVVALIRSFFGIRLGNSGIHFGWRRRRYVAYADIASLERKWDGKEPIFTLVLHSGKRRRLGSSLSCEQAFMAEFQKRSGCSVIRCPSMQSQKNSP